MLPFQLLAQPGITVVEYWYDDDYATVQSESLSSASQLIWNSSLDVSALNDGLHTLSCRFKDDTGYWSPAISKLFVKYPGETGAELHKIIELEYWYDGDYSRMQNDLVSATTMLSLNTNLDVSSLTDGLHFFSTRYKDEAGNWSPVFSKFFSKYSVPAASEIHELVSVEYWIDGDKSSSVKSAISSGAEHILNIQLDISALNDGLHFITYRFEDQAGEWCPAYSELFSKYEDQIVTENNKITKYRYWSDNQIENATEVTLSSPIKSLDLDELLEVSALTGGTHDISFQFQDSIGLWSSAYTESYTLDFNPRGTITAETHPACTQSLVTFTAEVYDTDSIYWDFGDATATVGRTATEDAYHAYSNSGTYTVTATLLNVDSAYTNTATTTITVNQSYGISVVAPENLMAYYPLNGDAVDAGTFGHDGTVFEAIPTTDRNGNADQAYYFDGVNDYIDIGDWENGGSMSFTFWARWDAFNNYSRIIDLGNGSSSNNIIVGNYQTGNNIFFSTYNNSSEIKYYTPALTLGQWDYIAATIDNQGEMKVYRNGALIGSKSNTYVPNILTRTAQYIGKSNFSADGYFKGAIDELKIYNKTLSAEEIMLDYEGTGGNSLPPVIAEICASEAPYSFGTQQLSTSGTYYETYQTVNGCDSIVQLNLTVHPVYSSLEMPDETNLFAYYPFNGNATDESGNGHDGIVNGATLTHDRNGNSSSAYLFDGNDGIDVSHSDELNMNGELSISCWIKPTVLQNAMIFGKSNYVSATNYLLRVQSDGNLQWEYDGFLNTTTKPLQANNWYHIVVTADNPGEHRKVYVNGELIAETNTSSGPFGSITNELTFGYASRNAEYFRGAIDDIRLYNKELTENEITALYQESILIEEVEICSSETPYAFGSQMLTESGTYVETFQSKYGCDSIVTLNLIVHPSYEITDSATICENELPYMSGETSLTAAGTYTHEYLTVDGCDSIIHFKLIVNDTSLINQEVTICENDLPYTFDTQTLTESGVYTNVYNNTMGCDSTVTLTLNVQDTSLVTAEIEICENLLPFTFGTQSLSAGGVYSESFEKDNGCDSTVILTLIVKDTFAVLDTVTVCESELPFNWDGDELWTSGPYTKTFTAESGCDSMVTLTFNVLDSSLVEQKITVCESELPFTFGTQTLNTSGVFTEVFDAANGCDSTVILTLNVLDSTIRNQEVTICAGDVPYVFGAQTLSSSGIFTEVFNGSNGCDSTVVLTLIVKDTFAVLDTVTVCESELPFSWEGDELWTSGPYTKTFTAENGCDSTVSLTFNVLDSSLVEQQITVCESELPFTFGTQTLDTSGIFTEVFDAANGCDSTVILTLNVLDSTIRNQEVTICAGDVPYVFGTQTLSSSGIFTEVFNGSNGCDSTVILNLTVSDTFRIADTVTICENDIPYTFGTQTLLTDGIYTELFTTTAGCDSTVVLVFAVNDTTQTAFADTICENDLPYVFGSQSLISSGVYSETFVAANGCDSVVTLSLKVHESYVTHIYETVSPSELPFVFGSQQLTKTGTFSNTYPTIFGCDSTITLHLQVRDINPPVAKCNPIEVELNHDSFYSLDNFDLEAIAQGSNDDISEFEDLTISVSPAEFTCENIGENAVTVKVKDAVGNQATCTTIITVLDQIANPQIDEVDNQIMDEDSNLELVLTGISGGTACETWDVYLSATSLGTDLISELTIDHLPNDSSALLHILLQDNQHGIDSIFISVQDSLGNSTSIGFLLTVNAVNDLPEIVQEIEDQIMTAGDSASITLSKIPGVYCSDLDDTTFIFSLDTENEELPDWIVIGETAEQYIYTFTPSESDTGCFNFILTIEDEAGGATYDTFRVCIDPLEVGVSVLEANDFGINLYPNPTRGEVNITLKSPPQGEIELLVTSISGSEVLRKTYRSGERISFNLSENISGTYLVILQMHNKRVVRKLILDKK